MRFPKEYGSRCVLLRRHNADLVFGIGGYTSPPVLLAAFLLNIPRVILEPNAYPGMANKLVAPLAQRIFLAFGATARHFASSKVRAFGAPIRQAFLDVSGRSTSAGEAKDKKTLLVFGGSGGAHALNLAMMEALPLLFKDGTLKSQLSVIHQTGQKDYDMVKAHYDAAGLTVEVMPFLFDMPTALRSADLVVSRSGAMTMAELTVCGKPAVLIPFPQSIYQHQLHNAQVLEKAGAALDHSASRTGRRKIGGGRWGLVSKPASTAADGRAEPRVGSNGFGRNDRSGMFTTCTRKGEGLEVQQEERERCSLWPLVLSRPCLEKFSISISWELADPV